MPLHRHRGLDNARFNNCTALREDLNLRRDWSYRLIPVVALGVYWTEQLHSARLSFVVLRIHKMSDAFASFPAAYRSSVALVLVLCAGLEILGISGHYIYLQYRARQERGKAAIEAARLGMMVSRVFSRVQLRPRRVPIRRVARRGHMDSGRAICDGARV